MSKRWTLKDDIFLATYHEVGADYVASHDLGHHGKNAGTKRLKALRESGVLEKIEAHLKAHAFLIAHHTLAFSTSSEAKAIARETIEQLECTS